MLIQESKVKDELAVTAVVCFLIGVGVIIGMYARSVSTNDRYLRATAERFLATAAYYDAETLKLKEGRP